jgi:hypothetical protein
MWRSSSSNSSSGIVTRHILIFNYVVEIKRFRSQSRLKFEVLSMNVITKHDSSLIVYNSADAVQRDAVHGNGEFTCRMSNVNRAGSHAVKLVPYKVFIPNVFPNIKAGANVVETYDAALALSSSVTVRSDFYSLDALLVSLNLSVGGNFSLAYDSVQARLTLTNVAAGDRTLTVDAKVASMLGFSSQVSSVVGSRVSFLVLFGAAPLVAVSVPYMGTTPIVHVIASKAANSNLLSSNSVEYSVLASVNMTTSGYGQYAVHEASDLYLGDIDFRSPRNMSDVDFRIVDQNFETLTIDPRFDVIIQLKVFHTDTSK